MTVPFWNLEGGERGPDYIDGSPWDTCTLAGVRVPGLVKVSVTPRLKVDVKKQHGADGGPTTERGIEPAKITIAVTIWTASQWEKYQELIEIIWRRPGKPSRLDVPVKKPKATAPVDPELQAFLDTITKNKSPATASGLQTPASLTAEQALLTQITRTSSSAATSTPAPLGDILGSVLKKNGLAIEHPACALYGIKAVVLESPGSPTIDGGKMTAQMQALEFIQPQKKAATRAVKGTQVPLNQHFEEPKNSIGKPPSQTDVVPVLSSALPWQGTGTR